MRSNAGISIVLPAKNEAPNLAMLLPKLRAGFPDAEVIVVDDGSSDDTRDICLEANVNVLSHPYSMGNGAAVKSGARAALGDILVFMDADGQHDPADIPRLLSMLEQGYDMAVGARGGGSQANLGRGLANGLYNRLASFMVGQKVEDLTSGFRAVRADKFREFLYLLPNGFSYPTTITMAFFRLGYAVGYVPIHAAKRTGKSHIKFARDGIRFLLIIFRVGTLYSPLKLFLPISSVFFILGISYYAYTYLSHGRFTNMSALLLITSVLVFLIGLVSEQITSLNYKDTNKR
ncbi:MAG: glycosyl transferase [Candidatus Muproteobacteria bacterium RBG_16_64_11]|uniref:Glycosyl transferase n=1 Tax=Candidatus Muproteobacteria bacterium RBG_16_64_11 TaxID=1817758 RepID=A0A1F6TAB5_9PROT|nr:MAG: glycosyl transferase [Candidatus Muproteobacteria bacterium RBG_16_64_11]